MRYVVCLLFSTDLSYVGLIKKNRPEWQKGFLNGPGGKCNHGESIYEAAKREFQEETGVVINDWKYIVSQDAVDDSYNVAYLVARSTEKLDEMRSLTDEEVGTYLVEGLVPSGIVASLEWILPLAQYIMQGRMDKENIWVC